MQGEGEWGQTLFGGMCNGFEVHEHAEHQGLQPYVNVEDYHEMPFPNEQEHANFGIDLGVAHEFATLYPPRDGMRHDGVDSGSPRLDVGQGSLARCNAKEG